MFLVNVEKCLRIFGRVYVSSDSDEILDLASGVGAIPIKRGLELCGDIPNIPVYQHAIRQMGQTDAIVAVQANSPTIDSNLIALVKKLIETGVGEVMTCHPDYKLYGSIWGLQRPVLHDYGDPFHPAPDVLIVDNSIDIHTKGDYNMALRI